MKYPQIVYRGIGNWALITLTTAGWETLNTYPTEWMAIEAKGVADLSIILADLKR